MSIILSLISDCSDADLQDTFVSYSGRGINGYNLKPVTTAASVAACLQYCLHFPTPVHTCDIALDTMRCKPQNVTALDFPDEFASVSQCVHHQRTCL